jgi:hypothetical protein
MYDEHHHQKQLSYCHVNDLQIGLLSGDLKYKYLLRLGWMGGKITDDGVATCHAEL